MPLCAYKLNSSLFAFVLSHFSAASVGSNKLVVISAINCGPSIQQHVEVRCLWSSHCKYCIRQPPTPINKLKTIRPGAGSILWHLYTCMAFGPTHPAYIQRTEPVMFRNWLPFFPGRIILSWASWHFWKNILRWNVSNVAASAPKVRQRPGAFSVGWRWQFFLLPSGLVGHIFGRDLFPSVWFSFTCLNMFDII